MSKSTPPDRTEAMISFTHGNPTPEEVAAVVAVVLSRRGGASADEPERAGGWAGYWRRTRRSLRPGPDAWRQSMRL